MLDTSNSAKRAFFQTFIKRISIFRLEELMATTSLMPTSTKSLDTSLTIGNGRIAEVTTTGASAAEVTHSGEPTAESTNTDVTMTVKKKDELTTSRTDAGSPQVLSLFSFSFICYLDKSSPSPFFQLTCTEYTVTGVRCEELKSACFLKTPCHNGGSCVNNDTFPEGYSCSCPPYFNGSRCEDDHRPCKTDTCWNNGTNCHFLRRSIIIFLLISLGTCHPDELNVNFICQCQEGWTGRRCESMINYCENITCENNGVCRSLFMNYTCECLGDSYSGRHCENTATQVVILQTVSKTFAYVGIIAMICVAAFIVIMDILKYCFGIDPVREERERMQREREARRRKRVIQRFVYVNKPTSVESSEETNTEATV